ncbi:MAG: radical SAM protein [Alphaproteobacteria bacterium]|nr:radical SAM protein [Alphaproteobacteria bacterium]
MREQLSINLSVGRSCFVRCSGCYNHFGKNSLPVKADVILNFLDNVKTIGVNKVTISGGDPISRPDILSLLEEVKKRSFQINLDTVGTALLGPARTIFFGNAIVPQVNAEKLSALVDLIGIPLDGPNSAVVETFRTGRNGIFQEQKKILSLLDEHGAKICVNTVVHKHNLTSIAEMAPILSSYPSIIKWQLFQYMPIGFLGYKNRDHFMISDEEYSQLQKEVRCSAKAHSFKGEIEFKGCADRKGNYLLVDSDGLAWLPKYTLNDEWNGAADATCDRIVIGDIHKTEDYPAIIRAVLHPSVACKNISGCRPVHSDFVDRLTL